ncbi:heparan-sulfate 6-O-sulfotransferase 3 isoform X2 [Motacilla alba alba]|uniref:heparan-sulfate 6-O-sulfotransferase 3 isoform X2 n=1 Tax=Motacilla alba alba TaxID=1094192 RepID=UPI0018D506C3|nr:heparan-sulfate 6-O-sulfotransferase 3 isoform X2 [Motacilla alba alba]
MERQTGSSGMVGCNSLQYIDGLQLGGVVMKSKSDEQLHCFPQTFSGELNVASFLSFSVSTEYEDDVDAAFAIWLLHCSSNNSLGKIADSDTSLIKVRNFYYITMLRDPVSRYLSEWKHVQRGATWKTSLHMCDGRSPTPDELPTCYEGDDWSGVSLQEFMDCSYNLASNRQVRMLADLSLVGCYNLTFMNESERNMILLQSAKNNLKNMAFFGLTEFQRKTQYLFERTFNLKFISPFTQFNVTRASNVDIGEDVRQRIEELNFLDMQLYEYAKDLFLQRFQYSKQEEHQKNRLKRREERRLLREQRAHQWPREEAAEVAVTEDYNSQVARW